MAELTFDELGALIVRLRSERRSSAAKTTALQLRIHVRDAVAKVRRRESMRGALDDELDSSKARTAAISDDLETVWAVFNQAVARVVTAENALRDTETVKHQRDIEVLTAANPAVRAQLHKELDAIEQQSRDLHADAHAARRERWAIPVLKGEVAQ